MPERSNRENFGLNKPISYSGYMSQEGFDGNVAERLARWQKEKENDPTLVEEDPDIENDPLFREIRLMIESGCGSRLLKGRDT